MRGRDRDADLDKLADAFYAHLDWLADGGLGLDGKRPFCWSGPVEYDVCGFVGLGPTGVQETFGEEELAYGRELWGELPEHLSRRWAEYRGRA